MRGDAPMPTYGEAGPIRAATCRCRAIASNAHRSDIAAEIARPAPAMTELGTIAPENSTAGKQSIGRARAAWAVEVTAAEASRPRQSAAMAFRPMVTFGSRNELAEGWGIRFSACR